jgi:hypothetical protein
MAFVPISTKPHEWGFMWKVLRMSLGLAPQGRGISRDEEILLRGSLSKLKLIDDSIENLCRTQKSATRSNTPLNTPNSSPLKKKKRGKALYPDKPLTLSPEQKKKRDQARRAYKKDKTKKDVRVSVNRDRKDRRKTFIDRDSDLNKKYNRKIKAFNSFSHIEEQAGSLLEIDFSDLLKHEELIIDLCLFGGTVAVMKDLRSTLLPLGLILNKYLRKNVKGEFMHIINWIREQIHHPINEQAAQEIDPEFKKPQGWWNVVRESTMWTDIYKLISYATCITVHGFDFEKLKKAQKYIEDTRVMKVCNMTKFVDTISAIVENVCTRVHQSYKSGKFLSFFHSEDSYQEWFNATFRVQHLYYEKQESDDFDRHGLLKEVMALIRQGEEIISLQEDKSLTAKKDKKKEASKAVVVIRARLRVLIDLRQLLMNVMNSVKLRETPYSLLICGCSSIGKSIFSEIMRRHFGQIRGLADIPAYIRNSALPHWENWESFYWCILLDDAACFNPDKVLGVDPSLGEIIQVINPIATQPPRADLSDKGRAAIKAQQVMITTNVMDLNVSHYFSHPAAVMRRCGFQIILEVREEYKAKATQGLDSFKANHADDEYPDWWYISVREPIIRPSQDPSVRRGCIDDITKEECHFELVIWKGKKLLKIGMITFMEWYNESIDVHFAKQQKILLSQKRIGNVPLCEHRLPCGQCSQCETQPVEEIVEQAGLVPMFRTQDSENPFCDFGPYESFRALKEIWAHCWSMLSISTIFITLALLMLRDRKPNESNMFMRARDSIYQKWSMVWDFGVLMTSWLLPAYIFGSIYAILLAPVLYNAFHPFDAWFMITGDYGWYSDICVNMDYFRQCAVMWLAYKADSYVDCIYAMGLNTKTVLGGTAFCLLVLFALAKMIQYFYSLFVSEAEEQGQAYSMGHPFNVSGEKDSVYARKRTEIDILDVPRHALSFKSKSMEEVAAFYAPNLFHVSCKDKSDESRFCNIGNCLFIRGHVALIQTHVLKNQSVTRVDFVNDGYQCASKDFVDYIDKSKIQPLGQHLMIMEVHATPLKKDLTLSLPMKKIREFRGSGFLVKREKNGNLSFNRVKQLQYVDSIFKLPQSGWIYKPERKTELGDCGSILFAETPSGPVLVGMHQYGNTRTDQGGATDLTVLEETIVRLSQNEIEPGTISSEKGKAGNLGDIHPKSIAITTQEKIPCEVYGSLDGHRQKASSHVTRTILADKLEEQGLKIEHTQPDMSYQASNRHFESMKGTRDYRFNQVQRCAMEAYFRHVMKKADDRFYDECHVVDQQTSINGQPGVRFVEAINLRTSAGFPYSESKKKHMFTLSGDWDDERFVKEHIQDEIDRIWDCYLSCKCANPISKASLKDEARKFKKVDEHNTRVFFGGSLPFTVVQRQLFLWFVRLVQKNSYLFMMAPGMDASSSQWHKLWEFLFLFSDDGIAGDYAGFDITMSADELHLGYEFIVRLGEALGADDDHINCMRACSEDVIHVLIDYFGTIIRTNCNPSGHALTVIINGIINVIRTITLFALQEMKNDDPHEMVRACELFFEKVHLMTYGDDNIMTVKDAPAFNHTYMQEKFAEMGIKYTMADKDAETVPYITFKDATFLKRGFRFESELGKYVAPLDEGSMVKALGLMIPSKVESMEQQLSQSIQSCHREAFFHGRERFEFWDALIKNIIQGTELPSYVGDLPSWQDYIEWYQSKDCVEVQSGLTIIEQAGALCERCGFDCYFVNYQCAEDMRPCQFCKRCRFDEPDLDCLFCGLEDACETCGILLTLSKTCDFTINSEIVRMYEGKCLHCKYKKSFLRILTERPNGLGRGDGISLSQNTNL